MVLNSWRAYEVFKRNCTDFDSIVFYKCNFVAVFSFLLSSCVSVIIYRFAENSAFYLTLKYAFRPGFGFSFPVSSAASGNLSWQHKRIPNLVALSFSGILSPPNQGLPYVLPHGGCCVLFVSVCALSTSSEIYGSFMTTFLVSTLM